MLTILDKSQDTVVLVESLTLTTDNVGEFSRNLRKIVQTRSGRIVVIDLRNVNLLGECGLNVLVEEHGRLGRTGGSLRLCGLNEQAQEKLTVTRMDRLLEIYPDQSAALADHSGGETS